MGPSLRKLRNPRLATTAPIGLLCLALPLAFVEAPSHEVAPLPHPEADSLPSGSFVLEDVRLFDGNSVTEGVSIWIDGGRIQEIDVRTAAPAALPRLSGEGRTVLPGLSDAHVHVFAEEALSQALASSLEAEGAGRDRGSAA